MVSSERILREKRSIARKVSREFKKSLGANLLAVGLRGSVARGTAEKFSDIDLLLILQTLPTTTYTFKIVSDTYCSLNFETWKTAISKVNEPHHELPETLGGFTKILGVYDPNELLPRLENQARKVPSNVFRKSAELAMIHSFEDFCRAKNAFLKQDDIVLKDNINNVTHSAANAVAALNETGFVSDREIFKAYRKFGKLPENFATIHALRYGNSPRPELFRTLIRFYVSLVDFCKREGVEFPVEREALENLA